MTVGLGPLTGPADGTRRHRRTGGGPAAYPHAGAAPASAFWHDGE